MISENTMDFVVLGVTSLSKIMKAMSRQLIFKAEGICMKDTSALGCDISLNKDTCMIPIKNN